MVDSEAQVKTSRPCLGINARARSYLQDHQQYRPPQQDGIDSIVEGGRTANSDQSEKSFNQYNGVPSPKIPFMIVDSKLTHAYSHTNCQPVPGLQPDSVIATILYKTKSPQPQSSRHSRDHSPSPTQDTIAVIPPALAPVRSISSFPFEPPPPDPDPLDRLYGSYISPICLTSFLHLFSSLPSRQGAPPLVSSHRCLDNPNHPLAIEITLSPTPDPSYLTLSDLRKHELIYRFEREWNVDVILQQDSVFRRYPRLVCFDMDSTLINEEVIDLIAASIGVEAEVSAITEQAMNGELDFCSSLRARVKLLRGVKEDIFIKLREVITPTNGARELLRALKRIGVRTAVFSGGFSPTTQWLAKELCIDYAYANDLSVKDGILTGEVEGTIVDRERKRELLLEVAEKEGISLSQVVAVGDGANDLSMLGAAGLGVAWNAKPLVQMEAHARLNGTSLLDLLFLFGFTVGEIEKLLC